MTELEARAIDAAVLTAILHEREESAQTVESFHSSELSDREAELLERVAAAIRERCE